MYDTVCRTDDPRHVGYCSQIGVGIGGRYLGDEFTLYQDDLPLFGYRRGERRLLSDYLHGAFKRALVLRPNF
jgi:hypothetical protein